MLLHGSAAILELFVVAPHVVADGRQTLAIFPSRRWLFATRNGREESVGPARLAQTYYAVPFSRREESIRNVLFGRAIMQAVPFLNSDSFPPIQRKNFH